MHVHNDISCAESAMESYYGVQLGIALGPSVNRVLRAGLDISVLSSNKNLNWQQTISGLFTERFVLD